MRAASLVVASGIFLTLTCMAQTDSIMGAPYADSPASSTAPTASDPADAGSSSTTEAKIAALVEKLGSRNFREREEASAELERLGGRQVVAGLRRALRHEDAEVRRRAEALLRIVERRLLLDEFLQPTLITGTWSDTSVAQILDDIARAAECAIEVPETIKAGGKTLTLSVQRKPLWEVLDDICARAGLSLAVYSEPDPNLSSVRIREVVTNRITVPNALPGKMRIAIREGKAPRGAICYCGAIRMRLEPASLTGLDRSIVSYQLEILPEPKLAWWGWQGVRIDAALDSQGQSLAEVARNGLASNSPSPLLPQVPQQIVVRNVNNRVVIQGQVFIAGNVPGEMPIVQTSHPVFQLQRGEVAADSLRLLKGVVFGRVQTSPEPVVVIDNILAAKPGLYKGIDEASVNLLEVVPQEEGDVRLRLRLTPPASLQNSGLVFYDIRTQRNITIGQRLELLDEKGQPFQLVRENFTRVFNNGQFSEELHVLFRAREQQPRAHKLVFRASRILCAELPFEFKDIPLSAAP